jgi:predicted RNA-binding Zn-ribbon protein involved in translation (DUF1610 family)
MARTQATSATWLTRRMCLACGYDGRELQGDRGEVTFNCPSCGCDLYVRPPQSYAQLEGLSTGDVASPSIRRVRLPSRSAGRVKRRPPYARTQGPSVRLARAEAVVVWLTGFTVLILVGVGLAEHLLR